MGCFSAKTQTKILPTTQFVTEQDKNSAKSRGVCEKFRNFALKQYKTFLHEEIYSRHPDGHHNALIVL